MNILKREMKIGIKSFVFWSLGLVFLVFAGMTKFIGIGSEAGAGEITELINKFPKVVLAVMGMGVVDIESPGGYYSVLMYYVLICAIIYAIHLANNAVSREAVDKTYEFIFTKPCKRSYVLSMKLLSGIIYMAAFSLLNLIFSYLALFVLKIENSIASIINIYSVTIFLVSFIFFALTACMASIAKQAEKGSRNSYIIFLLAFVGGIIYDMMENGWFIKLISPMKYFEAADILNGKIDVGFTGLSVALIVIFIAVAFKKFVGRDLNSV